MRERGRFKCMTGRKWTDHEDQKSTVKTLWKWAVKDARERTVQNARKNGLKWLKTDEKIKHGRGRYKAHESGRPKKKESGRLKQMDFRHSWVTKVYVELENFNFPDFSKLPLLPDEDMFDKIRSANGTSPSVVLIATFIFRSRANKKLSRF